MLKSRVQVKEVMTKNVKTCLKDSSLQDVAKMMSEANCGAIPVMDSKENMKPIGIITDRDIVNRTLAKGLNPMDKKAGECMSGQLITVTEDINLSDCLNTMEEKQIRRIIVVDAAGKCKGIVSQSDIAMHCSEGKIAKFLKGISLNTKPRKTKAA
jgi:CBS domain-containing protein